MKPYTKRIKEYKELIQEEYVRDTAVQKTVGAAAILWR